MQRLFLSPRLLVTYVIQPLQLRPPGSLLHSYRTVCGPMPVSTQWSSYYEFLSTWSVLPEEFIDLQRVYGSCIAIFFPLIFLNSCGDYINIYISCLGLNTQLSLIISALYIHKTAFTGREASELARE